MDSTLFITQIDQAAATLDVKPGILLHLFDLLTQSSNGSTTADLCHQLDLPHTHLGRILKTFSDYLQPKSQLVKTKDEFIDEIKNILITQQFYFDEPTFQDKLKSIFDTVTQSRPRPKREYDQFYATFDTVFNRAKYLHQHQEIYHRDLLFLGDDDITSVPLALVGRPRSIIVLDIDPDILAVVNKLAQTYHLPITTQLTDLRTDPLTSLSQKFDLVFTDPPYTPSGIGLFLDRAITVLKNKNSTSLYFCYGNSSRAPERTLFVQNEVANRKLIINSLIPNFNQYVGADSIGNSSSLYGCRLTPMVKTSHSGKMDKIYTYE
jgi:predicted methyltransferase